MKHNSNTEEEDDDIYMTVTRVGPQYRTDSFRVPDDANEAVSLETLQRNKVSLS